MNTALAKEKKYIQFARRSGGGVSIDSRGSDGGVQSGSAHHAFSMKAARAAGEEKITPEMLQEVQFREVEFEDREAEIADIQRSVRDVNEVFKDLAGLVEEQGEEIDMIESRIDNARNRTEGGVGQLKTAAGYQSAANKKLCYIFWILFFVVGIVILIIAKPWKTSPTSMPTPSPTTRSPTSSSLHRDTVATIF